MSGHFFWTGKHHFTYVEYKNFYSATQSNMDINFLFWKFCSIIFRIRFYKNHQNLNYNNFYLYTLHYTIYFYVYDFSKTDINWKDSKAFSIVIFLLNREVHTPFLHFDLYIKYKSFNKFIKYLNQSLVR